MSEAAGKNLNHDDKGRFLPGHKAHRPVRKRRALKTILAEAVDTADLQAILANGVADALENPTGQWAMLIATKLLPNPKPEMSPITLNLGDTKDSVEMARRVVEAVGRSEISPDAAQALLQSMAALNSMVETESLRAEIAELRAILGGDS